MALLMSVRENDIFANLTAKKEHDVEFLEPKSKTAYTNPAELCPLSLLYRRKNGLYNGGRAVPCFLCKDGVTLVCVTLNDRNDWNDHISLYDYAFEKYRVDCRTLTLCRYSVRGR